MSEGAVLPRPTARGFGLGMFWEVIRTGLVELWAHKLRSLLTLTLLMLGVFALVVMTSVLDGLMDKISTGFAGMSWDGTVRIAPKTPESGEDRKRFAMSPGLRYEDLSRLNAPNPKVLAFLPRAQKSATVRTPGGADPVGRDLVVDGVPFRLVGVQAPGQIFNDENYYDANGILIPLETYMDRLDSSHKLAQITVKLRNPQDAGEISAMLLGRVRQAHHGIEDAEVMDLDAEAAKGYRNFLEQMRGWKVVLLSLAGTVLLVGGVGVLSVMLISFSDRRFEIGLRKALGASDHEIFIQFLLEALVLAALGALLGTLSGALLCQALSSNFPYGLVVNPLGLVTAWIVALTLALLFGLYPAFRAMRLSPMEAMR